MPLLPALVWAAAALLGALVLVMLLGPQPALRRTPLFAAYVFATARLPALLGRAARRVCGERAVAWAARAGRWVGYERNPLVQLFFVGLVGAAAALFRGFAWDLVPNERVPGPHRLLWAASMAASLATFAAASAADPGAIRDAAHAAAYARAWGHDDVLYSAYECRTCGFVKPARSKHCSMCRACVARADHHCVWINNCVGHNNHPHFLAFLVTTGWAAGYTAYLSANTILADMARNGWVALPATAAWWHAEWYQYAYHGTQLVKYPIGTLQGLSNAVILHTPLAALTLFLAFACPLVVGFLLHHLYLNAWRGTTTNEAHKWEDVRYAINEGTVVYARDPKTADGRVFLARANTVGIECVDQEPLHAYDRGVLLNLRECVWPERIESVDADSIKDEGGRGKKRL